MKRFGLPKKCLLRKAREFEAVYRRGRRIRGKGFSLIFLPNQQQYNRLGISVHGKVRGAVRRNRIKRIIRESFRLHRESFPPASDIVFTVRPDFSLQSPEAIRMEIARVVRPEKCSDHHV